jgi:hypothetical protein
MFAAGLAINNTSGADGRRRAFKFTERSVEFCRELMRIAHEYDPRNAQRRNSDRSVIQKEENNTGTSPPRSDLSHQQLSTAFFSCHLVPVNRLDSVQNVDRSYFTMTQVGYSSGNAIRPSGSGHSNPQGVAHLAAEQDNERDEANECGQPIADGDAAQ